MRSSNCPYIIVCPEVKNNKSDYPCATCELALQNAMRKLKEEEKEKNNDRK